MTAAHDFKEGVRALLIARFTAGLPEAELMVPCNPGKPRSFCKRSASQAPPEVMPTKRVSGVHMARTPRKSSLYSASAFIANALKADSLKIVPK
jgi:hypothetical protein